MNFPPLRLAVLNGLVGLKEQLDKLDDQACPYDNETKVVLKQLLAPTVVEKVVEKIVTVDKVGRGRPSKEIRLDEEDQRKVLDQIQGTIENLNKMDAGDVTLETNERIQIAKTKTNLLDQLLKMLERHTSVAKMEEFKETVVAILNDLVDEKSRDVFLRRIEPFR